ncbi:hypothetical protein [Rheinheimera metallidurans]|uniref:hypothetical protein n=1 Tax=Rheinheimera metallidurans TaxID=2925781 RepID=UPI003002617E
MAKKKSTISKNAVSKKVLKKSAVTIALMAIKKRDFKFKSDHKHLMVNGLDDAAKNQKFLLLAIDLRKGWKAFGKNSMKEFIEENFYEQYGTLNRQLVAARVAYRIGKIDAVHKYSDDSMQPMNKLTKEKCLEVMEHVKQQAGTNFTEKSVTKRSIIDAMIHLRLKKPPKESEADPLQQVVNAIEKYAGSKHSPKALAVVLSKQFDKKFISQLTKALKK